MKTENHPISITIESDLLSRIPPRKLSRIVEEALKQIQKEVASSWLNDVLIEITSEELELRSKFCVTSNIHLQSISMSKEVLNDEIGQ